MAKSIIDIEVNDAAFKAFTAKFNAYRDAVKKLPKTFGEAEGKTSEMADNFAVMTAAMMAQLDLLHKHQKVHSSIRNDADKTAKAYKDAASSIVGATKNLLKWAAIGTGIIGGAFWALDKLANGVGNQRRAAQGLGVTTGQQAALGVQYSRYFDVNSNLENIANAKSDYSQRWAFGAMGVNPNGKDPAQLAVEMALRAKTIFDSGSGTQQEAQAHGLLQFYTMDELRRLHATSMRDLQESEGGYRRDVGRLSRQDAINKEWQDFGIKVKESGQVIENVFVKALSPLAPQIGKVAQAFADTAEAFLSHHDLKKWLDEAATGLGKFGEWVDSPSFQTSVKNFISDVGDLADAIHSGLVRLGIIKDHSAANEVSAALANSPRVAGGENYAMRWLMGAGWSKNSAAGIAANLYAESKYDPFAQGDKNAKTGKFDAYGIAQWHADRQSEYAKLFGHSMQSVRDRNQALMEQMAFVNYELTRGSERTSGKMIRDAGAISADQAGNITSQTYERPKDDFWRTEAQRRGQIAGALVTVNVNNATGGNASVQTAQAAQ